MARFATLCCVTLAMLVPGWARGSGTVTNCANADGLYTAVAGGGLVTFGCDGTITLTNEIEIVFDTTLDGNGLMPTLSGSNAFRIFRVNPGVTLTLRGIILADGRSTNGGAILNEGGTVVLTNCTFLNNEAIGNPGIAGRDGKDHDDDSGGDGKEGTSGGQGLGGAIYNLGVLTVSDCTFTSNHVAGGDGGAGGNGGDGEFTGGNGGRGGDGGVAEGGAIYSATSLALKDCSFLHNTAQGGNGGIGGEGGGGIFRSFEASGGRGRMAAGAAVFNGGTCSVENCTFMENVGQAGNSMTAGASTSNGDGLDGYDGGNSFGGGLCNEGNCQIVNSTFFRNQVTGGNGADGGAGGPSDTGGDGGGGGDARGGGLYSSGSVTVTNSTFSDSASLGGTNGAAGTGGLSGSAGSPGLHRGANIAQHGGTFVLKNSIIAYPSFANNSSGTITDAGNNISSDNTPSFTQASSRRRVDPLLNLIPTDNGGPTLTLRLLTNSPAIDAGDSAACPPFDQRYVLRPQGPECDIGAFEFGADPEAPLITSGPSSRTVTNGVTVTFSVAVTGDAPLTYQWRFNGTNLPGVVGMSLVLLNVQPENAGEYKVVVANNAGSIVSDPATLTVLVPATIVTQPADLLVPEGDPAMFSVDVQGTSPLTFQWQHNGSPLTGETNSSLNIIAAQLADEGTYAVVVSNAVGSATSVEATLTVVVPPEITVQPANARVELGQDAIFSVMADGTAPFDFQWRFNGSNLVGETSATLMIPNVQLTNSGAYSVLVSNSVGEELSDDAVLRVLVRPEVTEVQFTNSTFSVTVTTINDLMYTLVATDSLDAPTWVDVYSAAGEGTPLTLRDDNAIAPFRFYRIRVE